MHIDVLAQRCPVAWKAAGSASLRPGNATVRGAVERRFPIACGPRVYDSDPLAPQGSATDRWAIGPEFASDRGHSSNSRMVQAHGNRRHFPSADRNALKVCGAGRGLEAYAPTLRPCNRVPRRASLNGSSCSVRTYRKIPRHAVSAKRLPRRTRAIRESLVSSRWSTPEIMPSSGYAWRSSLVAPSGSLTDAWLDRWIVSTSGREVRLAPRKRTGVPTLHRRLATPTKAKLEVRTDDAKHPQIAQFEICLGEWCGDRKSPLHARPG